MDYEQKYKEILEWARKNKARLNGVPIEDVLPELTESEDERIRRFLIDILSHGTWRKEWPFGPNEVVAYLEKQKEPAEWSKNDTVFLNEIIDYFENKTVKLQHDIDMYAHWLKSLPERFNLQPKEEWGEEDEEMIGCIIDDIREAKRNSDKEYFKELCDKEIAWLKSIRPDTFQNGNSRPKSPDNWKPSEEQMNTLAIVIDEYYHACTKGSDDKSKTLKTLFEQLKKL